MLAGMKTPSKIELLSRSESVAMQSLHFVTWLCKAAWIIMRSQIVRRFLSVFQFTFIHIVLHL